MRLIEYIDSLVTYELLNGYAYVTVVTDHFPKFGFILSFDKNEKPTGNIASATIVFIASSVSN